MLPEITDAVLTRAIATPRMVSAGLDYWRRGLVVGSSVDLESGIIRASVKGSEPKPYQVEVRFGARGAVATMQLSGRREMQACGRRIIRCAAERGERHLCSQASYLHVSEICWNSSTTIISGASPADPVAMGDSDAPASRAREQRW